MARYPVDPHGWSGEEQTTPTDNGKNEKPCAGCTRPRAYCGRGCAHAQEEPEHEQPETHGASTDMYSRAGCEAKERVRRTPPYTDEGNESAVCARGRCDGSMNEAAARCACSRSGAANAATRCTTSKYEKATSSTKALRAERPSVQGGHAMGRNADEGRHRAGRQPRLDHRGGEPAAHRARRLAEHDDRQPHGAHAEHRGGNPPRRRRR